MQIIPVPPQQFTEALGLIKENGLPVNDIHTGTQLFIMEEGKDVIGTVAVEYDFDNALLRSLSVKKDKTGEGLGGRLVDFIEDYVSQQGVINIYILTNTASKFFQKRGYETVPRENAPEFIRNTSEFSSVCPASAVFMKKELQS